MRKKNRRTSAKFQLFYILAPQLYAVCPALPLAQAQLQQAAFGYALCPRPNKLPLARHHTHSQIKTILKICFYYIITIKVCQEIYAA